MYTYKVSPALNRKEEEISWCILNHFSHGKEDMYMNECLTEVELVFIVCVCVCACVNVVMFRNALGIGNSK